MSTDFLYPLRRLHGYLHDKNENRKLRLSYKKMFKENPNTVFLLMTPEHGNIGDHAIALAETQFLKNAGITYIELTGKKLDEMRWAKQLQVLNGFPIVLNGGGYLGTLWPDSENMVRNIIQKNPGSRIVILPNTIFYEDSDLGHNEFEKSKTIYNSHKHLYLYAREKSSYQIMKSAYKNVKLVPDMVLSMASYNAENKRSGCLLCMRNDREKTRTEDEEKQIYETAAVLFSGNVKYTDMNAPDDISVSERENAVISKMNEFSGAELVITDRLHGMILCAITGTPCIVINSKSPKVKGCYEWIKDLEYIRFAHDISGIADEYKKIPEKEFEYNNQHLKHYYEELKKDIIESLIVNNVTGEIRRTMV